MRPEHIENILVKMHEGQWFGFEPSENKVYENLVVHKVGGVTHPKPTKEYLLAELANAQAQWDAENADYIVSRRAAYLPIGDQLDMQYHDSVNGTTTWLDHVATVKSKYPKP